MLVVALSRMTGFVLSLSMAVKLGQNNIALKTDCTTVYEGFRSYRPLNSEHLDWTEMNQAQVEIGVKILNLKLHDNIF